jgi:DNA repair protein RadC
MVRAMYTLDINPSAELFLLAQALPHSRTCSTLTLAHDLLTRFGDLAHLADAPVTALGRVRGLGPVGARRLHAALNAGRLSMARSPTPAARVCSATQAAVWLTPPLKGLIHEEMHALYLDSTGRPQAKRVLAKGSDFASVVSAHHVFRPAVLCGAAQIVLAHNHPSGDPHPSSQDIASTYRLMDAANIIGVQIIDHLVVTDQRWTSMMNEGLMPTLSSWISDRLNQTRLSSDPFVGDPPPLWNDDTRRHDQLEGLFHREVQQEQIRLWDK